MIAPKYVMIKQANGEFMPGSAMRWKDHRYYRDAGKFYMDYYHAIGKIYVKVNNVEFQLVEVNNARWRKDNGCV